MSNTIISTEHYNLPQYNTFLPSSVSSDRERFSLTGLSSQAKQLISLAIATPDFLRDLMTNYQENREKMWLLAEAKVGTLTLADRQLLERLVELFMPDSSLDLIIYNGGCNDNGCWL